MRAASNRDHGVGRGFVGTSSLPRRRWASVTSNPLFLEVDSAASSPATLVFYDHDFGFIDLLRRRSRFHGGGKIRRRHFRAFRALLRHMGADDQELMVSAMWWHGRRCVPGFLIANSKCVHGRRDQTPPAYPITGSGTRWCAAHRCRRRRAIPPRALAIIAVGIGVERRLHVLAHERPSL